MPSDADACGTAASGVSTRCARSLARSTSGAESEPPGATALQGRRADTPPVRRMPRRVPRHPLQFGSRVVGSGRAGGGQPGPNDRQRLPHPNCKADAATRHRCDGCHGVSPGIPCSSGRLPGRRWPSPVGRVGPGPRREPRPARRPHPNCKADAPTHRRCDGCHGASPGIPCSPGRVWWVQLGQVEAVGRVGSGPRWETRPGRGPHPNCKADAPTHRPRNGCHGVSPGIPCSSGRLRWVQLGQVGWPGPVGRVLSVGSGRVGSNPRRGTRPGRGPHPNCKADGPTRRRCDGCDGVSPGIPCSSGRLPGRASGTARAGPAGPAPPCRPRQADENSFGGGRRTDGRTRVNA